MPETDTILYPEGEKRDETPHIEDVHGAPAEVTRKGDPERARANERAALLRDHDVEVDADGEFVIDETGQRVFVPYPTLGPRAAPRDKPRSE
jgi:hypothetical protein